MKKRYLIMIVALAAVSWSTWAADQEQLRDQIQDPVLSESTEPAMDQDRLHQDAPASQDQLRVDQPDQDKLQDQLKLKEQQMLQDGRGLGTQAGSASGSASGGSASGNRGSAAGGSSADGGNGHGSANGNGGGSGKGQ